MSKYHLIVALLTFGFLCFAQEEVPEYMKDGEITVTLKSGETYTFSTDDWKVVRRNSSDTDSETKIVVKELASEMAPVEPASDEAPRVVTETIAPRPRMIFSIIPQIGTGQDGVKTTQVPGGYLNEPDRGAVLGGTLCVGHSSLFAKFCGSAFSNRLYTFGIETEF